MSEGGAPSLKMDDASCMAAAERFAARVLHDVHAEDGDLTAWYDMAPGNRAAYAQAETIWRELDEVLHRQPVPPAGMQATRPPRRFPIGAVMAMAASLLLALVALPFITGGRETDIATRIGEQRTVLLADDSRVTLNTDTRLTVAFDKSGRSVELERGEAFFEVAHDARRPFIVHVGRDQIRAIGTEFIVRRDGGRILVTLLQGKVAVTGGDAGGAKPILLTPGQRVALSGGKGAMLDRPQLDTVAAWRRGEMILRGTPVAEAVREMNRYSKIRIEIGTPRIATAQLTGVFRLGKNADFANMLGALYDLDVTTEGGSLILRERKKS